MLLALSGGLTNSHLPVGGLATNTANLRSNSNLKKRFRTKFSQYQKDKMLEFAEKIGWKIQKRDEEDIQELCHKVGVDRGVLKVWMHNNKNTFGKKEAIGGSRDEIVECVGLDHEEQLHNNSSSNIEHRSGQNLNHHFETDSVAHVGTNGCSSSSS